MEELFDGCTEQDQTRFVSKGRGRGTGTLAFSWGWGGGSTCPRPPVATPLFLPE